MKNAIIIIILCLMAQLCLANKQNELPEEPWRAIVFTEMSVPDRRWEGNISIKLFGNYTATDSLMIEHSVKTLNGLCETIELGLTNRDRGNLEIFFLDSTNSKDYESIIQLSDDQNSAWQYNYRNNNICHFNLAIKLASVQESSRQEFVTNTLAHALYPKIIDGSFEFKNGLKIRNRPKSIFNPVLEEQSMDKKMSQLDTAIIKAVYSEDFAKLLPSANGQFNLYKYPRWVRKNLNKIIAFPEVLALFLFTALIIFVEKRMRLKIQNKFLRFNIISVLSILIFGIVGSFFREASLQIEDPYFNHFDISEFYRLSDITGFILLLLALGLPSLNVIRLIEIAIHRNTQHKYFRILLLFISTCLIPSAAYTALTFFGNHGKLNEVTIKAIVSFFFVFVIIGVFRALISFFILKEKELKIENEVKLANLRELKTKAELNALHSKINPHFLYNSLNSIAGLAKSDAEKTEHMSLSLSKLFRYSINKEQSDWSTLAEEMEMVNVYLDIEKVRFDDRLEFSIALPEELKSTKIPRFIIQPLVENAIKHGISKQTGKGMIAVSVCQTADWLEIVVADNGAAFAEDLVPGFGLQSIYDKLEILYPDRFELHFQNDPNKQIVIKLS